VSEAGNADPEAAARQAEESIRMAQGEEVE
jgi:hypothetical protein